MISNSRLVFAAAFAALWWIASPGAYAGELDLTGSLSSFTSWTGVGPWSNLTLTDRETLANDTPAIILVDQADRDAVAPTHSLGFVLDDYHTWSPRFFTYAAYGMASGSALATRNGYFEGDLKFGPALATVIGAGAGTVVNPDGTVQNYLNIGPTWYHNNFNATLRWLPSFTSGRAGASTGILTSANGAAGTTVSTLTLLGGSNPPYGVVSISAPYGIGERVLFAGFDVKHWVSPKGGYHVGIELEHLSDSTTGNLLYVRRALNVGIFREIGPGPAP